MLDTPPVSKRSPAFFTREQILKSTYYQILDSSLSYKDVRDYVNTLESCENYTFDKFIKMADLMAYKILCFDQYSTSNVWKTASDLAELWVDLFDKLNSTCAKAVLMGNIDPSLSKCSGKAVEYLKCADYLSGYMNIVGSQLAARTDDASFAKAVPTMLDIPMSNEAIDGLEQSLINNFSIFHEKWYSNFMKSFINRLNGIESQPENTIQLQLRKLVKTLYKISVKTLASGKAADAILTGNMGVRLPAEKSVQAIKNSMAVIGACVELKLQPDPPPLIASTHSESF